MNRPIEDLLKSAYQAKVEPITEERLSQLSAQRADVFAAELANDTLDSGYTRLDTGVIPIASRRPSHSRWLAPALAAAAVIVVAAGAIAVATSHGQRDERPAPPASHLSVPAPSASSTPPVSSKPSSSASNSASGGVPVQYLGRGKTGARADVPWSAVGSGWRLFQTTYQDNSSSIYLYDPADGRYLITDQVSVRGLVGWSPDGRRAMLHNPDGAGFTQLDLHTGELSPLPVPRLASFVAYTKPRGLAVLVRTTSASGQQVLQRYGLDGSLQLTYSNKINGIGVLNGPVRYLENGSAFVVDGADRVFLLGNDGAPRQAYDPPAGTTSCRLVRLWDDNTLLEMCRVGTSSRNALYLQPLDNSAPTKLIDQTGSDYYDAWQLSNQDVLLQVGYGQCISGYQILHPDGSTSALRLPAGVSAPGNIANMSGDLASFWTTSSCDSGQSSPLLDYNMVTGQTTPIGHGDMLNFPADN